MEKIKRIIKQIQAVQFNEEDVISSSGMKTLDNSIRELKAFEKLAECVQNMLDCPEAGEVSDEFIIDHVSDMFLDDITEAENNLYINGRIDGAKWLRDLIQSHNSNSDGKRKYVISEIGNVIIESVSSEYRNAAETDEQYGLYEIITTIKAAIKELTTKTD